MDFLNFTNYFDNAIFNDVVGGENTVCLPGTKTNLFDVRLG
jgi:hypothetical protein